MRTILHIRDTLLHGHSEEQFVCLSVCFLHKIKYLYMKHQTQPRKPFIKVHTLSNTLFDVKRRGRGGYQFITGRFPRSERSQRAQDNANHPWKNNTAVASKVLWSFLCKQRLVGLAAGTILSPSRRLLPLTALSHGVDIPEIFLFWLLMFSPLAWLGCHGVSSACWLTSACI